jgi:hypothetical protein
MVFVLAWIIGEAISLSCELLKFIFLIACVVVLLHHHSWAPLADVEPLKKAAMEQPAVLISCHYHFNHLGLPPSCYIQSYFGN